ncbi:hypothetical protein [Pseudoleptotrichia goodfellowii]|jgi:hypothetical protein|uniref:Uncharacterized protein n=1 Tax=Pseudoleptotrichia goodfellowii F0264 TaxID=596323 RepID=D0GJV6_9FUSO|nr:hypothetical protein [Pseudoleptotrichia goodfellowii]EEY35667.1 hypothetical protein HMPREF0554_1109 [Pseudoleptotrichia goodfellowii F0264]
MRERNLKLLAGICLTLLGVIGIVFQIVFIVGILTSPAKDNPILIAFIVTIMIELIFTTIGIVFLRSVFKKDKKSKQLKISGIEKKGKVVDIVKTKYTVNKRHLMKIIVKTDDGKVYHSEGDSEKKIRNYYKIGDKATVLVSSENEKDYEVQLYL